MKTFILVFSILVSTSTIFAQGNFETGMQQAFQLWGEEKPMEAIALFERIAQADKDKWQPLYHAANFMIVRAFQVKEVAQRSALLEKAKLHIDEAHQRSPENSELHTLEGFLYTGYVAMNPAVYAMKYSQKIMELHDKAIELNPENPRAHANRIEYEMGSARFFGQELQPFCDRLQKILPKFDAQKTEVPFAPTYGKERVEEIIANCGKEEK